MILFAKIQVFPPNRLNRLYRHGDISNSTSIVHSYFNFDISHKYPKVGHIHI